MLRIIDRGYYKRAAIVAINPHEKVEIHFWN